MPYVFLKHFFRKFIVMNITAAFVLLVLRFAVYDFPLLSRGSSDGAGAQINKSRGMAHPILIRRTPWQIPC